MRNRHHIFIFTTMICSYQLSATPAATDTVANWGASVQCALNARWSDYASPSWKRLASDFGISYRGSYLYVFNKQFAGRERIFDGVYWQRPLIKLFEALGRDTNGIVPKKTLLLPYSFDEGSNTYRANFYVNIFRNSLIQLVKPANLGDPLRDERAERLALSNNLWLDKSAAIVDPMAKRLLKAEVEAQIARFSLRKTAPRARFFLANVGDAYNYDRITHEQCLVAASYLSSLKLKRAAENELQILKNKGIARQRDSIAIKNIKSLSGSFPIQAIASHIRLNTPAIAACVATSNTKDLVFGFSVLKNGTVDRSSITLPISNTLKVNTCMIGEMANWVFPGPFNNPLQRFEVNLQKPLRAH